MEKIMLLSIQKRVQECDKKVSIYQSFSHIQKSLEKKFCF